MLAHDFGVAGKRPVLVPIVLRTLNLACDFGADFGGCLQVRALDLAVGSARERAGRREGARESWEGARGGEGFRVEDHRIGLEHFVF